MIESTIKMRYQLDHEKFWLTVRDREYRSAAPGNRFWYAVLLSEARDLFRDGLTLLDYGCGNGALGHFVSNRLTEFTYYGIEPVGSTNLKKYFEENQSTRDHRITLDYTGSENERLALKTAEVVVLGSVFTHLEWRDSCAILEKLRPIVDRGGRVIFSCFLNDEYVCYNDDHYPEMEFPTYHIVHITLNQIADFCRTHSMSYRVSDNFYESRSADPHVHHSIVCLTRA